MEVFNLNIRPGKACPVLHCSQFDKGRMFRANLFDGSEVFTLTGSETLSVIEKKIDGNMVTIGVTNTSDSYVVFGTTEQMTALAGCQPCELRIVDGEDLIGSLNFLLDCEESPDTGIESESAIHNLQEQIGEAVAEQYSGEDVIFDDEPTEGHGAGFAVKSGGLKTYIPKVIGALDDVNIDSPSGNQAIVWNPITRKWENGEVSTVGSIDDLDDVDTTGKGTGDSLRFDPDAGEDGEWVAQQTVVPIDEADYEDLQEKQPCTFYAIEDGSPLDYTAGDILYEEGGTATVWDKVEAIKTALGELPTEIRCGVGNYSGLKGGGHANRVTVPISFSTPMTGSQYAVFIAISDAYSDYPYIQGYCFGASRTANGFTATIVSMSSNTTTEVSGSFYWVAVRYK